MALKSYLVPAAAAAILIATVPSRLEAAPAHVQATITTAKTDRIAAHPNGGKIETTVAGLQAVSGVTCAKRADMVNALGRLYKEKQQSTGLVSPQAAVELFVSDTGDWTILATGTNGVSCMMAAGDGWDTATLARLPGS
ncbi:MAG: hypothetical protein EPN45_24195 [Rhizobiaceae bacterium]|jgi:hypothetical protein|nr:MAG: hypothetical protein EPN45_24195 [Rhizobiaceae bacterium]